MSPSAKETLRKHYRQWRTLMGEAQRKRASALFTQQFLDAMPPKPGSIVAAYWPTGYELDVKPLLYALMKEKVICALPATQGNILVFRQVSGEEDLQPHPEYTFHEPKAEQEQVTPDIIIVPLLAFDRKGHRLGYGGGFYDRTFAGLREKGPMPVLAGAGFAGQEMEELPAEAHDVRLDWVITDKEAIAIV